MSIVHLDIGINLIKEKKINKNVCNTFCHVSFGGYSDQYLMIKL